MLASLRLSRHAATIALALPLWAAGCVAPAHQAPPHFEYYSRDQGTDLPGPDTLARADGRILAASGYGLELHAVAGTYTNDTNVNPAGVIPAAVFMVVTLRDSSGNGPTGDWILSFEQSGMVLSTMRYPKGAKLVNGYPGAKAVRASGWPWDVVATDPSDSSRALLFRASIASATKTLSPPPSVAAVRNGSVDGGGARDAAAGTVTVSWVASSGAASYVAALIPFHMPLGALFTTTVPATAVSATLVPTTGTYDVSVTALDVDEVAVAADTKQVPTLPAQVNASEGTGSTQIVIP